MTHKKTTAGLFFVFVFLILSGNSVFGLTPNEREELKMLPHWFPYSSCQESKVLKQCFLWTQDTCEKAAQQATQNCLTKYQSQWRQPLTGDLSQWQLNISLCVIRDLRNLNRSLIVDSMACRNKGVIK